MEKLHSTGPTLIQQYRANRLDCASRGSIRAIRFVRVGNHAAGAVKFKLYSHPRAVPYDDAGDPGVIGPRLVYNADDTANAIAKAAPELYSVSDEITVGDGVVSVATRDLNLPYYNRRKGAAGGEPALYLWCDTPVIAQQWYVSLDIAEGAI